MNYHARHRAGAPIGSGAIESLGAQLPRRLRCSGQFWQRPGLANLLGLADLVRNQDDHYLWNGKSPPARRCAQYHVPDDLLLEGDWVERSSLSFNPLF